MGALLAGLAHQPLALPHDMAVAFAAWSLAGTAIRLRTESAQECHRPKKINKTVFATDMSIFIA